MTFLFEILISFILGNLFFFLVKYCLFNYYSAETQYLFTKGISTDKITFIKYYQEILISRLGIDEKYSVSAVTEYLWILSPQWTIFDIKKWIESLEEQDYVVTIEIISKQKPIMNSPRIMLSREFIMNSESNPLIISSLIKNQFDELCKIFYIIDHDENYFILIRYTSLKITI